jgi:hypothetical protein
MSLVCLLHDDQRQKQRVWNFAENLEGGFSDSLFFPLRAGGLRLFALCTKNVL